MKEVAKEIIEIKIKKEDTLESLMEKFYFIMRKYNIKQGTWVGNARQLENPDWVMCEVLFIDRIQSFFGFYHFYNPVPKDLEA